MDKTSKINRQKIKNIIMETSPRLTLNGGEVNEVDLIEKLDKTKGEVNFSLRYTEGLLVEIKE